MDEKKKQGTLNGDTKNENGGHKNDELKNFIASYVAEAIKNEKATWEKDFSDRIVSEREDAAKMATMSAEDRAKAEMDKRQKDFENERQQYVSERAEFEAAKELAAQNRFIRKIKGCSAENFKRKRKFNRPVFKRFGNVINNVIMKG